MIMSAKRKLDEIEKSNTKEFTHLPSNIIVIIVAKLNTLHDIINFSLTCKYLMDVLSSNARVWKRLCIRIENQFNPPYQYLEYGGESKEMLIEHTGTGKSFIHISTDLTWFDLKVIYVKFLTDPGYIPKIGKFDRLRWIYITVNYQHMPGDENQISESAVCSSAKGPVSIQMHGRLGPDYTITTESDLFSAVSRINSSLMNIIRIGSNQFKKVSPLYTFKFLSQKSLYPLKLFNNEDK